MESRILNTTNSSLHLISEKNAMEILNKTLEELVSIAEKNEWPIFQPSNGRGSPRYYISKDIDDYLLSRRRLNILDFFGYNRTMQSFLKIQLAVYDDAFDVICPVCFGFAIKWDDQILCEKACDQTVE